MELLNRNTSFEKNELNFGNTGEKILFLFMITICGDYLHFVETYYEAN